MRAFKQRQRWYHASKWECAQHVQEAVRGNVPELTRKEERIEEVGQTGKERPDHVTCHAQLV